MITDFPSNPLTNMAGMQSFSFSPYQNIAAISPPAVKKITTAVTFNGAYRFFDGYSTCEQLSFDEKFTADENGGLYDWTVTGFYPGDEDTVLDIFEQMRYNRHLVLTKDFNNRLRLIGIAAPLTFTSIYGSGKQPSGDAKGFTFTFTGQSRFSAPVYAV